MIDWLNLSCSTEQHVSEYAKINATEDFAESYMVYLIEPARLRSISSRKFEFIDELFRRDPVRDHKKIKPGWIA